MEQQYFIYKLTNTANGKGYIGYSNDIKRRMRQHKATALTGKGQAIHAAIRKYGWDSFVVKELYRNEDKKQTLEMEDHFINLHETKGVKGYNITRGGQQGPPKGFKRKPMTEEQLLRHRERMKDPEIRRRISEGTKGQQNRLGKSHVVSDITKEKMKITNRGKGSERQKEIAREFMMGNQHAKGHVCSDEHKRKISDYMKARDHSYKRKLYETNCERKTG